MKTGFTNFTNMNIEAAKINIIKTIAEIQNESFVEQLLLLIDQFKQKALTENGHKKGGLLTLARLSMPNSISLKTLKKEQGYSTEKLRIAHSSLDRSIWEGEDIKELIQAI